MSTPLARVFLSRVLWHPVGHKLKNVVAYVVGAHGAFTEITVALPSSSRRSSGRTTADSPTPVDAPARLRARLEQHRFALLRRCSSRLSAAPYSVNFGAFLYVRFLAPAFALAVLLLAPRADARGVLVVAPAVALVLAPVVAALPQLSAAAEQTRAVEPLIARVEQGRSVAVVHFGKYDRGLLFDPTAFGNRVLAERGGRELHRSPSTPSPPSSSPPSGAGTPSSCACRPIGWLQPATDLTRIEWVLAHVHDQDLAPLVVLAFEPQAGLVATSGEWLLFRSRLAVLPLTSPDGPRDAKGETLQDRVTRLLRGDAPP